MKQIDMKSGLLKFPKLVNWFHRKTKMKFWKFRHLSDDLLFLTLVSIFLFITYYFDRDLSRVELFVGFTLVSFWKKVILKSKG